MHVILKTASRISLILWIIKCISRPHPYSQENKVTKFNWWPFNGKICFKRLFVIVVIIIIHWEVFSESTMRLAIQARGNDAFAKNDVPQKDL